MARADNEDQLTMALDWASDHFVRLYTRETDDDLLLSWEARAVWHELLKKFDKQGKLATKRGVKGLAALVRIPFDVVQRVVPELIEDGRLAEKDGVFSARNYQSANYTPRSPGARMQGMRDRESEGTGRRKAARKDSPDLQDLPDEHVTERDAELRDVTPRSHNSTDQIRAKHTSARARGRASIPDDWVPREQERTLAQELGLDVEQEAREFLTYWQGDGRLKADWDLAFESRLRSQAARRRGGKDGEGARDVQDL